MLIFLLLIAFLEHLELCLKLTIIMTSYPIHSLYSPFRFSSVTETYRNIASPPPPTYTLATFARYITDEENLASYSLISPRHNPDVAQGLLWAELHSVLSSIGQCCCSPSIFAVCHLSLWPFGVELYVWVCFSTRRA